MIVHQQFLIEFLIYFVRCSKYQSKTCNETVFEGLQKKELLVHGFLFDIWLSNSPKTTSFIMFIQKLELHNLALRYKNLVVYVAAILRETGR